MLKPVCVKCQCFFRPKKNGFPIIEGMPTYDGARRGTAEQQNWIPYKLWNGDLWACPECGFEIVVGFGSKPTAERHQSGFAEDIEAYGAKLQINDC